MPFPEFIAQANAACAAALNDWRRHLRLVRYRRRRRSRRYRP
jgi:hypothetical protein